MSLTKQEVATSDFIDSDAPSKVDGRTIAKKAYKQSVNRNSTIYTLWLLAVKHKIGLLAIGNIVLVLNWVFPEWTTFVLSLLGK